MSLSFQINIRILLLSMLVLALGFAVTIWRAKQAVDKEIGSSVQLTAHILSCGLSQQPGNAGWLECFHSLEQTRHLKIQLRKASGEIVQPNKTSNELTHDKLPPSWFIDLVGNKQTIIQKQLTVPSGEQIVLQIQANPIDEINEVWEESVAYFATLMLLILLILLAIYWVLNKSIKVINTIVAALQTMETGEYRQKIPEFSSQEFDKIAKAINHMAGELEQAQQQNRALTQHSLEILEAERKQLAQELHDELGQSLTAIKFMALTAERKPDELKPMSEAISAQCDHLIKVVRGMMRQLHPLVLSELGLKAAIEDLVVLWSGRHSGLRIKLDCADAVNKLEDTVSIQIFRVIQECLTNIVRHAEATEALISLKMDIAKPSCVNLCVQDNGKACQPEQLKRGFGVLAMKERIQSLGGSFAIETSSNAGVKISANIPV